jgi:hypothetical protein
MIFKIVAFIVAAIPIFLVVRSILFGRSTPLSNSLREFKKHVDLAVSILLVLIGCLVLVAVGNLGWTWWTSSGLH